LKVFTVSQFGDLPFFIFLFCLLARTHTSSLTEVLPVLPLLSFEYVLVLGFAAHLLTFLGLCLQVAVFLKAAQWFFYP